MLKIKDITKFLETIAPLSYQESYDNSGLLTGNPDEPLKGILVTLDCIEGVIEEAINKGCNLVVAHHPIVFSGLKKITGKNYVERTIIKAIKNDIGIYAIHTNLDSVLAGVNAKICEKMGLQNLRILAPKRNILKKLTTFVPIEYAESVLKALSAAGAGNIGNYTNCSFTLTGTGTFQPNEKANPHIGQKNQLEKVTETRIEVILPAHLEGQVLAAMHKAHPYEEVAYYMHLLENQNQEVGAGMIGELPASMDEMDFMATLKSKMQLNTIRHTRFRGRDIKKVAVCGGSGSFLLKDAIAAGADVFVTADFKYHQFFDADDRIIIADIGHYESEVYTKDLLYNLLQPNFKDVTVSISQINTNPVHYFS